MMRATKIARTALFTAMVVEFGAAQMAHAQGESSEREQALEARVAELERLVNTLLSQQQQAETQIEEVKAVQAQMPAPVPVPWEDCRRLYPDGGVNVAEGVEDRSAIAVTATPPPSAAVAAVTAWPVPDPPACSTSPIPDAPR